MDDENRDKEDAPQSEVSVVFRRRRRRDLGGSQSSLQDVGAPKEDAEVERILRKRPDSGISTDSESRTKQENIARSSKRRNLQLNFLQTSDGTKSTSPEEETGHYFSQLTLEERRQRRRYASTGDLRQERLQKRRMLPDPLKIQQLQSPQSPPTNASSSNEELTGNVTDFFPQLPKDQKLLEAQFQMLYKENIKLDKAYGDLQSKVMEENPELLSSPGHKHQSPREAEWEVEKQKFETEIKFLKNERIAELEQSEASLRCQVMLLEEKLVESKTSLAKTKEENDDLQEECNKLSSVLAVMDAEKSMLDSLKEQNHEFRKQLGQVEDEARILATKLAEVADEKSQLELELCNLKNDQNSARDSKLQAENSKLKSEVIILNERISSSEHIKETLLEQIKTMEDEYNFESKKLNEKCESFESRNSALQNEKANLTERKEQLEMEQELHEDMTSKLNGRISDLQNHIETLKSQLQSENENAAYDKLVQHKLELEKENKSLKDEITKLEGKFTELHDQNKTLEENHSVDLMNLMQECNLKANQQRELLEENEKLQKLYLEYLIKDCLHLDIIDSISKYFKDFKDAFCQVKNHFNFPHSPIESPQTFNQVSPTSDNMSVPRLDLHDLALDTPYNSPHDTSFLSEDQISDSETDEKLLSICNTLRKEQCIKFKIDDNKMIPLRDLSKKTLVFNKNFQSNSLVFNQLSTQLTEIKAQLKTLYEENQELRYETKKARSAREESNYASEEMQTHLLQLSRDIEASEKERTILQSQLDELSETLSNKHKELLNSQITIEEERAKVMDYENEIIRIKESISSDYIMVEDHEQMLSVLKSNLHDVTMEKQNLEEELSEKSSSLENVTEENLKMQILENKIEEIQNITNEYNKLTQQHRNLKISNANLESKLTNSSQEYSKLEAELKEQQKVNTQLMSRVHTLQGEKAELLSLEPSPDVKEENISLKMQIEDLKIINENFIQEKKALSEDLQNLADQFAFKQEELAKSYNEINSELNESIASCNKCEKQLSNTEFIINGLKEDIKMLEKEKSELKRENQENKFEIEQRCKAQAELLAEAEQRVLLMEKEKFVLHTDQLSQTDIEVTIDDTASMSSTSTISDLNVKVLKLKKHVEKVEREKDENSINLKNEITQLKKDLAAQILINEELDNSVKTYQKKLQDALKLAKSNLTRELNSTKDSSKDTNLHMRKSLSFGDKPICEVSCESEEDLKEKLNNLQNMNRQLVKDMEECQEDANRKLKLADDALDKFEEIEVALVEEEKEVDRLNKERDVLLTQLDKMGQVNADREVENTTLKKRIQDLEEDLTQSLSTNKIQIQKPKMEINSDRNAVSDEIQCELDKYKKISENLKHQLEDTECLVVAHKNHLSSIEEQNTDLENLNKKLKNEIMHLKGKAIFLPENTVMNALMNKLQVQRLVKTSPAKFNMQEQDLDDSFSQHDSYTEKETARYEDVLELLCTKVEKAEETTESQKSRIMKLQQDLLEREDGAKLMQRRIGMLETSCEELKTKLKDKQKQLNEVQKQNSPQKHLEEFKQTMNKQLKEKEELINAMTSRLEELENYLQNRDDDIKTFNEELRKREDMSKEDIRSKEEAIEKLSLKLENMSEEVENKTSEVLSLRDTCQQLTFREKDAVMKLNFAEEKIEKMSSAVSAVKTELEQKSEQLLTISSKARKLEESWSSAEEVISKKQSEVDCLLNTMRNKEESWMSQLGEKDGVINDLKDKCKKTSDLNATVEAQDSKIQALSIEMQNLSDYSKKLQTEKEANDLKLTTLVAEKDKSISQLSSRLNELEESEVALKQTLDEADKIMDRKESEKNEELLEMENSLRRSVSEAEKAQMTSEELQEQSAKMEEKVKELEEQLEVMRNEEKELNSHMDNMEVEREMIKTSLASLREENQELTLKNEDLDASISEMSEEIDQLNANVEELNHQVLQLQNQVEKLNGDVAERDTEIEELMDENKMLAQQLEVKINEYNQEKESMSSKEEDYKSKTSHLSEENERLSLAYNLVQDEHKRIKKELDEITMDKEDLEDEIYRIKSERSITENPIKKNIDENDNDRIGIEDDVFNPNQVPEINQSIEDELRTAREEKEKFFSEALSLRSQNQALRQILNSFDNSKSEKMIHRRNSEGSCFIPKLELGSIASESIVIAQNRKKRSLDSEPTDFPDDATELDFEDFELGSISDIMTPTKKLTRAVSRAGSFPSGVAAMRATIKRIRDRLKASEEDAANLKMQAYETLIENEALKGRVKELVGKNEKMEQDLLDSVHEDFQKQINHLRGLNTTLKIQTDVNEQSIKELSHELRTARDEVKHWKSKCEELEKLNDNLQKKLEMLNADDDKSAGLQKLLNDVEELQNKIKEKEDENSSLGSGNKDLQNLVKELQGKLSAVEAENNDLQNKLIDLDQDYQQILEKDDVKEEDPELEYDDLLSQYSEIKSDLEILRIHLEDEENTPRDNNDFPHDEEKELISTEQLLEQNGINEESSGDSSDDSSSKSSKKEQISKNMNENGIKSASSTSQDTENDVPELENSFGQPPPPIITDSIIEPPLDGKIEPSEDILLMHTISSSKINGEFNGQNEEDVIHPLPEVTADTGLGSSSDSDDSAPPSFSVTSQVARQKTDLHQKIKAQQDEIMSLNLKIEKLEEYNKELLEGSGSIMTQDEKEAMEKEIATLRGKVALLERNNRLFTDEERKDLKQELERSKRKVNSLTNQLRNLQESIEVEEVDKMKGKMNEMDKKIKELEEEIDELKKDDTQSEDSRTSGFRTLDSDVEARSLENIAKINQLDKDLEDLKKQYKEKEEEVKDRDVLVDELQHRVQSLMDSRKADQDMSWKLKTAEEEKGRLTSEVAQKNKTIQLYQSNLSGKDEQIERRGKRIEDLENQIKLKNEEIKRLQEEISLLKRGELSLKRKCEDLEGIISRKSSPSTPRTSPQRSPERFRSPSLNRSSPRTSPITSRNQSPSLHSSSKSKISQSSLSSSDKQPDKQVAPNETDVTPVINEPVQSSSSPSHTRPRGRSPTKAKPVDEASNTEDTDSDARAVNAIRNLMREDIAEAKQKLDDMGQTLDSSPRASQRNLSNRKYDSDKLSDYFPSHKQKADTSDDEHTTPVNSQVHAVKGYLYDSDTSEHTITDHEVEKVLSIKSKSSLSNPSQDIIKSQSSISSKSHQSSLQQSPGQPTEVKGLKALKDLSASFHSGEEYDISKVDVNGLENPIKCAVSTEKVHQSKSSVSSNESDTSSYPRTPSRNSKSSIARVMSEDVSPERQSEISKKDSHHSDSSQASRKLKDKQSSLKSTSGKLSAPLPKISKNLPLKSKRKRKLKKKESGTETSTDESEDVVDSKIQSSNNLNASAEIAQPFLMGSLLPDDRASLIEEIRKAREEAKMWWNEVTENDREKRKSDRKVAELQSEMERLKEIEERYNNLKSKHDKVKSEWARLAKRRAKDQLSPNQDKTKQDKSDADIQANLNDRQELAKEDQKLRKDLEDLIRSRNSLLTKPSDKNTPKKSPEKSQKNKVHTSPPFLTANDKEMNDIRNGLDYLSSNFCQVLQRKYEAEMALQPTKAKVNRLKQKCKERDIVLAKLLLKLRKQGNKSPQSTSDSTNKSRDNESLSSSAFVLENLLDEANHLVHAPPTESESDFGAGLSDVSENERKRFLKSLAPDNPEKNEYVSPPRPPVAILRTSMNTPPPVAQRKLYVAVKDYDPALNSSYSLYEREGVAKLLPDLVLHKGDNVLAIGDPDQRLDGKMYQLSEVNGKIGFVPSSHLTSSENIEGNNSIPDISPAYAKALQLYEKEKAEKRRKLTSERSKSASDTSHNSSVINQKLSPRRSRSSSKNRSTGNRSNRYPTTTTDDSSSEVHHSRRKKAPVTRSNHSNSRSQTPKRRRSKDQMYESNNSESSHVNQSDSDHSVASSRLSKRPSSHSSPSGRGRKANSVTNSPNETVQSNVLNGSIGMRSQNVQVLQNGDESWISGIEGPIQSSSKNSVRTSTPYLTNGHHSNTQSPYTTPDTSAILKNPESSHDTIQPQSVEDFHHSAQSQSMESTFSIPPALPYAMPDPPSSISIEKIMGRRSLILKWTPPDLDIAARSNGVPVIGYDIYVNRERKLQISGAYSNKAIVGELDLDGPQFIEVRTVGTAGTQSDPVQVSYLANVPVSPRTSTGSRLYDTAKSPDQSMNRSSSKKRQRGISPTLKSVESGLNTSELTGTPVRQATAKFDYNPLVDSPYKNTKQGNKRHTDHEISMEQGDEVVIIGDQRSDGFCEVQRGNERGFAPASFLTTSDQRGRTSSFSRHKKPAASYNVMSSSDGIRRNRNHVSSNGKIASWQSKYSQPFPYKT